MHICPSSYPRSDIIDVEVQILIQACLQAEGADDAVLVVFLRRAHISLAQLKYFFQLRLPQCTRIMAADRILRDLLVLLKRELLLRGQTDVPIQACLEPPIDA